MATPGETRHLFLPLRSLTSRAASLSAILIFTSRGEQRYKVDLSQAQDRSSARTWEAREA